MNKLKNYILWPILALLSIMAMYLTLVLYTHKFLNFSPSSEELLWQYLVEKDILKKNGDDKGEQLQAIIDSLPIALLPTQYPKIKIIIANDNQINAFAAPGGRIILTTGLLNAVKHEKTLLFIIGHEMGHLARRDHLYELSRVIIAKIYSVITWSNLIPELLMLADNSKTQSSEFLADQWALRIVYFYYDNFEGIDELFKIIEPKEKTIKYKNITSTHPEPSKRLEKLNYLIKNYI